MATVLGKARNLSEYIPSRIKTFIFVYVKWYVGILCKYELLLFNCALYMGLGVNSVGRPMFSSTFSESVRRPISIG